jgi:hypothetical protein
MKTPKTPYDPAALAVQLGSARWFNNSEPDGSACVDVAFLPGGSVGLRDSTQTAFALSFTSAEWDAFLEGVRAGKFDRPGGEGSTL